MASTQTREWAILMNFGPFLHSKTTRDVCSADGLPLTDCISNGLLATRHLSGTRNKNMLTKYYCSTSKWFEAWNMHRSTNWKAERANEFEASVRVRISSLCLCSPEWAKATHNPALVSPMNEQQPLQSIKKFKRSHNFPLDRTQFACHRLHTCARHSLNLFFPHLFDLVHVFHGKFAFESRKKRAIEPMWMNRKREKAKCERNNGPKIETYERPIHAQISNATHRNQLRCTHCG